MKNYIKALFIGAIIGLTTPIFGQISEMDFDGVNDYISFGDTTQGSNGGMLGLYAANPFTQGLVNSDFSIEFWMHTDTTDWPEEAMESGGIFFAFNSYYDTGSNRLLFGIDTDGFVYVNDGGTTGLSAETIQGTTFVADGECHHIAFTYNLSNDDYFVYVDGVLEGSFLNATFVLHQSDIFSIGQEWDDLSTGNGTEDHETSQHYYGGLDDFRVWSTTRTVLEIADNMFNPPLGTDPDLYAYYDFDQGTPGGPNGGISLADDVVSPGIDGDLIGFALNGPTSNFVSPECVDCFAEADSNYVKITSNITYTSDVVWDGKVYIDDNVIVSVSNGAVLDITNVDAVFGVCAGIDVLDGHVRVNNSVLRPCNVQDTWRGITFYNNVQTNPQDNVINESTFKNAEAALYFQGVDGLVTENLFSNCYNGVRIENVTDFNHPISGNRFITETFYPEYADCRMFVDNVSAYGIYLTQSQITSQVSQNEFINTNKTQGPRANGIVQMNGGGTYSSNVFTDLMHGIFINRASFHTIIENNAFEVNYATPSAVNVDNSSIFIDASTGTLVEVNNNTLMNNENSYLSYAGIYYRSSSNISISDNHIEGFNYGIFSYLVNNCQVTGNSVSDVNAAGIYHQEDNTGVCYITCNEVKTKRLTGGSYGFIGINMDDASQVTSNCLMDAEIGMYFNGSGNLPLIRNNYLYNYTLAGINVLNHTGNIGTGGVDPGMNTLWSNDNTAVDIQSAPNTIFVADNFGMFNITPLTVTITSNNSDHSTASCGHQIFNMPSQGNLNINYTCENIDRITQVGAPQGEGFVLVEDHLSVLKNSRNPFNDINLVIGTYADLAESDLTEMINSVSLSNDETALLYYHFYANRRQFNAAQLNLSKVSEANEEQVDYKWLGLLELKAMQHGWQVISTDEIERLESIVEKASSNSNTAVLMLRTIGVTNDYVYTHPTIEPVVKSTNVRRIEADSDYLNAYPNPASTQVTVEVLSGNYNNEIQLLSMTGEVVRTFTVNFVSGQMDISLDGIENGIYFVVLTDSETGVKQKVKIVKLEE